MKCIEKKQYRTMCIETAFQHFHFTILKSVESFISNECIGFICVLPKYFIKLLESDSDSGVLVKYMLNVLVFLNLMKVIQQYKKIMC